LAECEETQAKKNALAKKLTQVEENIKHYQEEVVKLKTQINEINLEKKKKQNIQEGIISERDILSVQLYKRQEELQKVVENLQGV
jgi:hypothetical protein